ncbi:hypothetical protein ACWEPC_49600, partial [Nonomuraea sp. NPDC004297]
FRSAAAFISRYAALHDSVYHGWLVEEHRRTATYASVETGMAISTKPEGGFSGYLHDPGEILAEFTDAGLPEPRRYGLQGAFWLYGDVDDWLDDDERRELLLDAARRLECEPSLLGVSGHLLAVTRL